MVIKIVVKTINLEMFKRASKVRIPFLLLKARLFNFPRNFPAFQLFFYDWESVEKTGLRVDGNSAFWEYSISGNAQFNIRGLLRK
jgi:hypothetical protein